MSSLWVYLVSSAVHSAEQSGGTVIINAVHVLIGEMSITPS